MSVVCFKHKKPDCECIAGVRYRATTELLPRQQAINLFYASKEVGENGAYSAAAVNRIVQCYLTVADALSERSDDLREALEKAGFRG